MTEPSPRLNPSLSHPRYVVLTRLRWALVGAFDRALAGKADTVEVDYGADTAPYRPLLTGRISRYIAADLAGSPGAEVALLPDGRLTLADASADLVLSTQVMEHVDDPILYLSECRRVLKPSGRLILSTHGHWMFHPHPGDYWRWMSMGLRRVVKAAGFMVERQTGILNRTASGLQLVHDGLYPKLPKLLRPAWSLVLQQLIIGADRLGSAEARDQDAALYVVEAVVS